MNRQLIVTQALQIIYSTDVLYGYLHLCCYVGSGEKKKLACSLHSIIVMPATVSELVLHERLCFWYLGYDEDFV